MAKALYIAEKPSVAQEFAKALKLEMRNHNGYKEGETAVVTWCVGHLVTMSYPEVYDEKYWGNNIWTNWFFNQKVVDSLEYINLEDYGL